MTQPETHTLGAPGALLHYDVRRNDASTQPVLLMIASPMGAAGFATLAGHFTDRTVVTYDPRGAERSKRTDGARRTTTEEHVDDLHRLIEAVGTEKVDILASSGGAVNALALLAKYPEQVRVLVAHEPPAAQVLPDREEVLATCDAILKTYQRAGYGPAMAKFIALAGYPGPLPPGFAEQPPPDPAGFGLPTEDDGSRDDPLVGLNMPATPAEQFDFDALRAASASASASASGPRIVIGVGEQSASMIAGRAAIAVAERLGTTPVTFPGGHAGFGDRADGKPDEFAAVLRTVLG
jgi:pimeloyl-ACP methyl ester carboxylesterase